MDTTALRQQFTAQGFCIARGLFSPEEAAQYRDHYMLARHHPSATGNGDNLPTSHTPNTDPLRAYPRLFHMHRWDQRTLHWLIEPRLDACMTAILGRSPYAVQTMVYFKPPGARGQSMHQDNFFLRAQPGTCIAAWMALDPCDEANGCLQVVPGSHTWPLLCTEAADTSISFTDLAVPIPPDAEVVPMVMEPGDVLFFNGQLVHGSLPNTTGDRFRRALIGHYIEGQAEQVAEFYQPALCMDGTPLELQIGEGGGPCGVWVEREDRHVVELSGEEQVIREHE